MKHRFKFIVWLIFLSVVGSGFVSGKQPRQSSILKNAPRRAPTVKSAANFLQEKHEKSAAYEWLDVCFPENAGLL